MNANAKIDEVIVKVWNMSSSSQESVVRQATLDWAREELRKLFPQPLDEGLKVLVNGEWVEASKELKNTARSIEQTLPDKKLREIDVEILDLVKALNLGGVPTTGSCSGHGKEHGYIILKDERTLIILPAPLDKDYVTRELQFNQSIKLKGKPITDKKSREKIARMLYFGFEEFEVGSVAEVTWREAPQARRDIWLKQADQILALFENYHK